MDFAFRLSDYFVLFGAVSLILGIIGYVRAKSVVSLIAGGLSGMALVTAGILVWLPPKEATPRVGGYVMGLCVCALLLGRFFPAFLRKKQIFPAGIMTAGAFIGVIIGVIGWLTVTGAIKG